MDSGSAPDTADESPELPPLAPADVARPWATLAVPHHSVAPHIVRTRHGFVALAREQINSEKVVVATYHYLYRSDDGITWHRLPFPTTDNPWISVVDFAYGGGRYVLLGWVDGISVSTDLLAWSPPPSMPTSQDAGDVIPLDARRLFRREKRFFGLGVNDVIVSSDGLSWARSYVPLIQGSGVAFGNGVFVISGAPSIYSSTDTSTWDAHGSWGPYVFAVFVQGRFYVDHLTSADGATWQPSTEPIANDAAGGYLFNDRGDNPYYTSGTLLAWRPGETVQTVAVEPPQPMVTLTAGVGPETIAAPLPGGETCLDHPCLVVDGVLYLIR